MLLTEVVEFSEVGLRLRAVTKQSPLLRASSTETLETLETSDSQRRQSKVFSAGPLFKAAGHLSGYQMIPFIVLD